MSSSPVGSFAKFTVGFLVFISISLGITIVVNQYTASQTAAAQNAAAIQAMLKQTK